MVAAADQAVLSRIEQRLAVEGPVADAVRRVVGEQSWVLVLGRDGRVRALSILGRVAAPTIRAPTVSTGSVPPAADEAVIGRRLRGGQATPPQLLDLALRDADPAVRMAAVRAGLRALAADPGLEEAVESALGDVDDRTLAGLATTTLGDEAATVLRMVAVDAAERPIGRRARGVLARLR